VVGHEVFEDGECVEGVASYHCKGMVVDNKSIVLGVGALDNKVRVYQMVVVAMFVHVDSRGVLEGGV
jgi:hypothetical protein